jgi:ssDNA-binding Zn-finger/Zn-ribbon topoisomerase 1
MTKANRVYKVDSGESCIVCGDELVIHTHVKQEGRPGDYAWIAADGDDVKCPDCGFLAYVGADSESADIYWDETTPHNRKCSEDYAKRRTQGLRQEGKP